MITYESSEAVSEWVKARIPCVSRWMDQYMTLGVKVDDTLQMGIVFDAYTGHDMNMHVAIDSGRAVTRASIRAAFSFPFEALNCRRVTALVPAKNIRSRALCERLGFTLEGCKSHAFKDDDELIFGMLKEGCRWL